MPPQNPPSNQQPVNPLPINRFPRTWLIFLIIIILVGLGVVGVFAYRKLYIKNYGQPAVSNEKIANDTDSNAINSIDVNRTTTKLATIPKDLWGKSRVDTLHFSPDGRKVAYKVTGDESESLFINDQRGKAYYGIDINQGGSLFSPDGSHVAYEANTDDGSIIVLDGQESQTYRENPLMNSIGQYVLYSADGKQVAYVIRKENFNDCLFLNGKEVTCGLATDPVFSPDSKQLAYAVIKDDKRCLIVNRKEYACYDGIPDYGIIFSQDSKHLAYEVTDQDKNFIVVDGIRGTSYPLTTDWMAVQPIGFSPDGKRFMYLIKKDRKTIMVIDGKEGKPYDHIESQLESGHLFSPDSKRTAYLAEEDLGVQMTQLPYRQSSNTILVVDDKEVGLFASVENLIFSPNSKHYAAVVTKHDSKKSFILMGGIEYKTYNPIYDTLRFTPNDELSYLHQTNSSVYGSLVVNEKIISGTDYVKDFFFSNDSNHVAYPSYNKDEKMAYIVMDGNKGKLYDEIYLPIISEEKRGGGFTSDGKLFTYGARLGNELWWVAEPVK